MTSLTSSDESEYADFGPERSKGSSLSHSNSYSQSTSKVQRTTNRLKKQAAASNESVSSMLISKAGRAKKQLQDPMAVESSASTTSSSSRSSRRNSSQSQSSQSKSKSESRMISRSKSESSESSSASSSSSSTQTRHHRVYSRPHGEMFPPILTFNDGLTDGESSLIGIQDDNKSIGYSSSHRNRMHRRRNSW